MYRYYLTFKTIVGVDAKSEKEALKISQEALEKKTPRNTLVVKHIKSKIEKLSF